MFRLLHDAASGCTAYLLAEQRLRLRCILRTHEHDAMLLRASSAFVALGAPVVELQLPQGPSGRIDFGGEHVPVLATPGHTASCGIQGQGQLAAPHGLSTGDTSCSSSR
jgi:hypothetical protein